MKPHELLLGDCLQRLRDVADDSVDMVLCDPPYGTTACKWDEVIPFAPMWKEIKRVTREGSAVVFTASQPFTSALVMSEPKLYQHSWRWVKSRPSNPQLAKKAPLKFDEDVVCFSIGTIPYYPQGVRDIPVSEQKLHRPEKNSLGHCVRKPYVQTKTGYPRSVIEVAQERGLHPTQKPVGLMSYLLETYTKPGASVLDFAFGSGTTGVACVRTGRRFIGIERDRSYFEVAYNRMADEIGGLEGAMFRLAAECEMWR